MSRRPSSAVIDLTSGSSLQNRHGYHLQTHSTHSGPSQSTHRAGTDRNNPPPPSRGVKRRRLSDDTIGLYSPSPARPRSSPSSSSSSFYEGAEAVEAVDLTDVNDDSALAKVLAKQRADAVKAQAAAAEPEEGRTTLTVTKCAICMDTPTDATTTICGMLSPFSLLLTPRFYS